MKSSRAGKVMSKRINAKANNAFKAKVTTGTMGREAGNVSHFATAKRVKPGDHSRPMGRMG